MLYLGKHLTIPGDPLQPFSVLKIYNAIINPNGKIADLVRRLQKIQAIDPNKYRKMKTQLPYLVCAQFQPCIRRKENFLKTERFFLDIDHLSQHDIDQKTLKNKLQTDPQVEMYFTSPGGDGLKILFRLANPITDRNYYAIFYKKFCLQWSKNYQLTTAVDIKTNDVSRCCFVSYDPKAYFNKDPLSIVAEEYLPKNNFQDFLKVEQEVKQQEKEQLQEKQEKGISSNPVQNEIEEDTLEAIKKRVGQRIRKSKPSKQYYQPEELASIEAELKNLLAEVGGKLAQSSPLNYGRSIKVTAGKHWAELNIFYGKKGATVVKTTKTGSNAELAATIYQLIRDYFEHNY